MSQFLPKLQRMTNNLFDNFFTDLTSLHPQQLFNEKDGFFLPSMDVSQTENDYCIELDLPGISEEDISIKIDNGVISIQGKRSEEKETKKKEYYCRERYSGEFNRSMSLPANIDASAVEAKFSAGVLKITIPKKSTSSAQTVKINRQA